ncbi:hypothetical protein MPSEU_000000200 [Mayamaea pseudoterrestris]|nr:hypothetical protein MPSEU_000000200 [Mayamaea pseudoterrestris]
MRIALLLRSSLRWLLEGCAIEGFYLLRPSPAHIELCFVLARYRHYMNVLRNVRCKTRWKNNKDKSDVPCCMPRRASSRLAVSQFFVCGPESTRCTRRCSRKVNLRYATALSPNDDVPSGNWSKGLSCLVLTVASRFVISQLLNALIAE